MPDSLYPVTVPKWGIEMQEGTVTAWQVAAGGSVNKGDDLVDIETDKIVNTLEAPVDGRLCRQLAEEGDTLRVGELLGVIATAEVDDAAIEEFVQNFVPADASFGIDEDENEDAAPVAATVEHKSTASVRVSPVARRLADKLGIDLSDVEGSGRGGRISKEDVEAAAAQRTADPTTDAVVPLTSRRRTIARKLEAAKRQIPHYYLTRSLDVGKALAVKAALDGAVSLNAILLKAVADALVEHPGVNCHVLEGGLRQRRSVDINMAVDTEHGLAAPLIRDVGRRSLQELTAVAAELVERARHNQLGVPDLEIGGFTVSNLGALGIETFTAIINPPQAAILAVGAIEERPVCRDGQLGSEQLMSVTLSADHRVIDGADGARFLGTLAASLDRIGR